MEMSVHLHRARQWTACMLGAVALSPLAWGFGTGSPLRSGVSSEVTGRVTFAGRPVGDMTLCLDAHGQHSAYALLRDDGTFRLISMTWTEDGARPGHYHAHLYTHKDGPRMPSKYADPATSGIELEIVSGWNDFQIDLQ
jgi:hypothetical protein